MALQEMPVLNTPLENAKAGSELRDIHVDPVKVVGRGVRPELARTKEWTELQEKKEALLKEHEDNDLKLEGVRAKKTRGGSNQAELDKLESQLVKQQADAKTKIDEVEAKMISVQVEWEKENPEQAKDAQPAGSQSSVPKGEGDSP
jgi:predicted nuclease with TOPRIM domain